MILSTHQAFEHRYPDEAAYAIEVDRQRRARGLAPLREFPCRGTLEAVGERDWPMLEVACDGCGFETTIRNPSRAARDSETANRGDW